MLVVTFLLFIVAGCHAEVFHPTAVQLPSSSVSPPVAWRAANITKYPFFGHIQGESGYKGPGVLITLYHALTPAHYFAEKSDDVIEPSHYMIRMGDSRVFYGIASIVQKIVVHEKFNYQTRENDVAIVLTGGMELGTTIAVIPIPVQDADIPENNLMVSLSMSEGPEGRIINPLRPSDILVEAPIRKESLSMCNTTTISNPDAFLMCARLLGVTITKCQQDPRGVLIYNNVVVGLPLSYNCDDITTPTLYTRVSKYSQWIDNTVSQLSAGVFSVKAGITTLLIPFLYLILSL